MSQIMKISMTGLLLIIGLAFLGGCGSSTPNTETSVSGEGEHAAGWLPAGHMIAARADQTVCTECHGSDYLGGITRVSCSSCHLGGKDAIHPLDWGLNTATLHGAYVNTNGTAACANAACHGSDLAGVTNSGPSCTSCHLSDNTSVHPLSWTNITIDHAAYVNSNGATGCSNTSCHGTNLGGVTGSGPACSACHEKGSPITLTGCTSCHTKPPSGTVYPEKNGSHTIHNAFSNVTDVCDTCHSGAGTTTSNHYNGVVDVQLLSTYNAKSGPAVFNPDATCSLVSCHGGQQSPTWLTGRIDVNTQCESCHEYGSALATPEYNSFYSGRHVTHVNSYHFPCTRCHDTAKLAVNHFTTLNTTTMEGPASATLNSNLTYTGGTCTPTCHANRTW